MLRLVMLAITTLSGLALAAPHRQTTSGGGCCTLIFVIIFVAIYRSGGTDWGRAIGAALFPGIFGWFIWRDRELGGGARWVALITGSLQVLGFVAGIVLGLAVKGGAFDGFGALTPADPPKAAVDLSKVPEDESLGLHPVSSILSDPPGAKVFVNGEARGKTPLETKLSAGERNEVRVELAGYFPASQDRSPDARERLTFSFTLKAAAQLVVKSEPPGARVLVGTKEVLARTPGTTAAIEPGEETEVLVLLDGYQAHREKLTPPTGETPLEVSLTPGVKLAVSSIPTASDVFVDGVWMGVTPVAVFVAPKGKHTVEVKREGWAPAKRVFASVTKPTSFDAKLVDTARVRALAVVAKARAKYDKVNQALEKLQTKIEQMSNPPPKLEHQRLDLEADMEKAATALEKAESELKTIEEDRSTGRLPPPPADTEPEP